MPTVAHQPFMWSSYRVNTSALGKSEILAVAEHIVMIGLTVVVPWVLHFLLILCRVKIWSLYLIKTPVPEPEIEPNRAVRQTRANRTTRNNMRRRSARRRRL